MLKYLLMLTLCAITQTINGKTLFDYNVNPDYDLVAEESNSYLNFWPRSDFYGSPVIRYRHQSRGWGYENFQNNVRPKLPIDAFDLSAAYDYPELSEEYSEEVFNSALPYHPHEIPSEPPRRFPPPPVYDNDFINPWAVPEDAPRYPSVQSPPLTTPRPLVVQEPAVTTPTVYVAPKLTTRRTTPAPPSSTKADEDIMLDIDLRFGRD